VPDCVRERSVLRDQQQRDKNEPQECASHRHDAGMKLESRATGRPLPLRSGGSKAPSGRP
jgi:hypothetical protein